MKEVLLCGGLGCFRGTREPPWPCPPRPEPRCDTGPCHSGHGGLSSARDLSRLGLPRLCLGLGCGQGLATKEPGFPRAMLTGTGGGAPLGPNMWFPPALAATARLSPCVSMPSAPAALALTLHAQVPMSPSEAPRLSRLPRRRQHSAHTAGRLPRPHCDPCGHTCHPDMTGASRGDTCFFSVYPMLRAAPNMAASRQM